jgi:dihydropyrimidinase
MDLVIRNAHLVTESEDRRCDIGVVDGRVAALGESLPEGRREIDARGRLVLPGGVDGHCHLDQPIPPPAKMADDFESGTRSAACGGTTTVIPFAAQAKGQSLAAAVEDYHRRAADKACIDYAFHLIVSDPAPRVLAEELPRLIRDGYTSFKIYMTYDDLKLSDREMLDVMDLARREGAMVMVHAENSDAIAWLTDKLLAAGRTAPRHHADARPAPVEREATHRAIMLAELIDVPILIVHVSGGEAIEQIRWAQDRGLNVYAETCPQYLFLTAAHLGAGYHGAKCVCSPPPRDEVSQQSVWQGLANGTFHVFSSDHAPFRYDDARGKRPDGTEVAFPHIPNGIPGLETRLPLLFSEGLGKGRIDLHAFVAHRDQPRAPVRPVPAQGNDRRGQRRRPGDLGRAATRHHPQRAAAPRGRLHALRGLRADRVAGAHALARRDGVGGRRLSRRRRAWPVPQVRPAGAGAAASGWRALLGVAAAVRPR